MEKEDLASNDIYRIIAPVLLTEQHDFLFRKIKAYMRNYSCETLGIFGTGQEARPFGERLPELFKINPDLNVIFLDINPKVLFGGEENGKPTKGLEEFIMEKEWSAGRTPVEGLPNGGETKTYFFVQHNFKEKFPFKRGSIDCIDSTLSLHHATQNYELIRKITRDIYRILSPGGLFHWGTGISDMKYSNKKMEEIRKITAETLGIKTAVIDERDLPHTYTTGSKNPDLTITVELFKKNKEDRKEPGQGLIRIPVKPEDAEKLRTALYRKGMFEQKYENNMLTIPLIDPNREEDRTGHLAEVDRHYLIVLDILKRKLPKNLGINARENAIKAILKEWSDARQGIVEYYTRPEDLKEILENQGFWNIRIYPNRNNLLSNIIAMRPHL
ncbi:class I SAM-dependent methyltransferase [Candidatus Woesearchaeota archaeon]|nr:class I SAM-dependent methyltransferase [Candidatus Woesearchaeota archaeon]MBW3016226.1 class I SAM-dependent methyltransferase [Candidatus Woesearchaeota archaeon]